MTSVRHNISDFLIIELENVADHLSFTGFDYALLMSFADHHDDLLFCHILLNILWINAGKADKKADRAIDECNKRSAECTDQCHYTNGGISPFLSIFKSQTFRKKNAENSDKINNDQTDDQVTDNCGRPIHQPCPGHQEECQVRKERPCNKCAGDDRHGCTNQINGTHKGSRLSDKMQDPGSTAVAFLFLLGQNGLVDSGNSYFCSGKSCINQQ